MAVPEAGTMACCYTWGRLKRMLVLFHAAPYWDLGQGLSWGTRSHLASHWACIVRSLSSSPWHRRSAWEVRLGGLKPELLTRQRLDLSLVCLKLCLWCEVLRTVWHCGKDI